MQIRGEQLASHLAKPLGALYVVYGDAPLLVLEAADAIRAAARKQGYDEREVLTALSGFDWGELTAAASNLSLFGGKKLIDLRLPTGKPGKEGGSALSAYCQRMSADNILLVTLPQLDWKEEKAVWFSTLAQAGVAIKFTTPTPDELPGWIAARLARQQQQADDEGLRFMAERVEGNLLAAHQEIQKLALLYPVGKLSAAEIRDAVLNVARYNVDDLRGALLSGDLKRFSRTLEGLRQEGEAPPLALWAMTEEIRALAQIKAGLARNMPFDGLCKELHIWGQRAQQLRRPAQTVSARAIKTALELAATIDRRMKGLDTGDVWEGLLRLGMMVQDRGQGSR